MTAERFTGETGKKNWLPKKDAIVSLSGEVALHGIRRDGIPNRSGSAPPSIEGSIAVLNSYAAQQHTSPVNTAVRANNNELYCEEELLRSDPSYVPYYMANVNLNPRLPPPITSRQTRHLTQHVSHSLDSLKSNSDSDGGTGSYLTSMSTLPTHKEEHDDVQLPNQDSIDNAERILSGKYVSSLEGRPKSLVDLIQADFPRTPSPVYSSPTRLSTHGMKEERQDTDSHASPLLGASVTAGKIPKLGLPTPGIQSHESMHNSLPERAFVKVPGKHAVPREESLTNYSDDVVTLDDSNLGTVGIALSRLSISSENEDQHSRSISQPNDSHPQASTSQLHALQSHGMGPAQNIDQSSHGQLKLTMPDKKSVLQSTGMPSPLYAAANYLTSGNPSPFYSAMQQASGIAPQYSLGGYAFATSPFPPFLAGYPLPGTITMTPENPTALAVGGMNVNAATNVEMQNLCRHYGQFGLTLQPPFPNSFCVPYLQQTPGGAYGVPGFQYDHTTQSYDLQKTPLAYSPAQRHMHLRSGNLNLPSPIKVGIPSPSHYGSPPNVSIVLPYPASPLVSMQLPGSPLGSPAFSARRTENIKVPACSVKNSGACSGWQASRGGEKVGDSKTYSILEELKSNKARKFELSDIIGHVAQFSTDQHGSRFIQQKLENCSSEEKANVFKEVLPQASMLMTDVFGNYVIQKFFEYGSIEQRKELADQLVGRVLSLSLQMYGCRVIQKALEVIELDQKTQLVVELDGNVMRCVRDQNGNHVIQKCIECVPTDRIVFIISSFHGHVSSLSMHPYGCRVIQRVLEHCTDEFQVRHLVDEILHSACMLSEDQYGNYVIQHVLESGRSQERSQIIHKFAGQVVRMSQHKFASNVIEKCLEHGDSAERRLLIEEIVGQTEGNDVLLVMMKDQYANYVIQKILDRCNGEQREILLNRIKVHLQALKRYTYGKHIAARMEQLSGEAVHAESRAASD